MDKKLIKIGFDIFILLMLFKENSPENEHLINFTVDLYNDTSIVKKYS